MGIVFCGWHPLGGLGRGMIGLRRQFVHAHRDAPDFGTYPLPHPDQAGLLDLSPSPARASATGFFYWDPLSVG